MVVLLLNSNQRNN